MEYLILFLGAINVERDDSWLVIKITSSKFPQFVVYSVHNIQPTPFVCTIARSEICIYLPFRWRITSVSLFLSSHRILLFYFAASVVAVLLLWILVSSRPIETKKQKRRSFVFFCVCFFIKIDWREWRSALCCAEKKFAFVISLCVWAVGCGCGNGCMRLKSSEFPLISWTSCASM